MSYRKIHDLIYLCKLAGFRKLTVGMNDKEQCDITVRNWILAFPPLKDDKGFDILNNILDILEIGTGTGTSYSDRSWANLVENHCLPKGIYILK